MRITTVCIDLAKNVFQIPVGVDIAKYLMQEHFINEHTGEVIDKQVKRDALLEYFSNRDPCLIDMEEACGGAQYWCMSWKTFLN